MTGNFLDLHNFNSLLYKLNMFICNYTFFPLQISMGEHLVLRNAITFLLRASFVTQVTHDII